MENLTQQPVDLKSNLIEMGAFVLIALASIWGIFAFENSFSAKADSNVEQKFSSFDYAKENVIPDNGAMRFSAESKPLMEVKKVDNHRYLFELKNGEVWGNFSISDADVDIMAGKIVVMPDHAAFNMVYDGTKAVIDVYDGDVYLGFLEDGVKLTENSDRYSEVFMNRMLVSRDSRAVVIMSKVDVRVKELLHSKLVKEFQYSAIPDAESKKKWVKDNELNDRKFIDSNKQKVVSDIFYISSISDSGMLGKMFFTIEEVFTFVPEKKSDIRLKKLFTYLNDAIYYANSANVEEMRHSLQKFNDYLAIISVNIEQNEKYTDKLDQYVNMLSIFNPGDMQHEVLLYLLDKKFIKNQDKEEGIDVFWRDVYKGMNQSKVLGEQALNTYYKYFEQTLIDSDADPVKQAHYKSYISYQNQLFDNLFFRYPDFYKDGYFAMKNTMEQEMLRLYNEGQLKKELEQYFISNKFIFLKRLKNFFFAGQLSVEDTKAIMSRLIEEIRDLMPSDTNTVAITQLFESQLNDIAFVWGYLSSPEYYSSKTYGATHDERYKAYLKERDRIWSFVDIQKDVLGETPSGEVSIAEAKKAISDVFLQNKDYTNIKIGDMKEVSQRYTDVSGVVGGYSFMAVYDRDYKLVKDIRAYGELISDQPVKIDSLLELMTRKFATLPKAKQDEKVTMETNAQRIARIYISTLIAEAGFDVTEENITVVSEDNVIYRIDKAYVDGETTTPATFDYLATKEKVTNVFIVLDAKPVALTGEFTLEELKGLMLSGKENITKMSEFGSGKRVLR